MGEVMDAEALKAELDSLKAAGKRVVFTNGCFDIIHVGHIRYLKEARKLGDVLVVGLNSDESVGGIKAGRPIVPEAQRAEVLAALESVDYVTIFRDPTPLELIRKLSPDVLVKGGDWPVRDIVGSDLVPETRSLPFVPGMSTTSIINKIREPLG